MVVTLTGTNDFMRSRELRQLVEAFVSEHTDISLERYDGEDATADRMRESIQSMPFLTARKMVVLREPSKQKAFAEAVQTVLGEMPDTTDLIIVEPKLDKRSSYYKILKQKTEFRDCAELDANGLAQWASEYANQRQDSLRPTDARLLIDRVGPNQQLLSVEIDKLLAYEPHITKQSIELLTERLPQSTVFALLDAAFAGNTARALELYREQRALRVEPQTILAMLAWQLHVLAVVATGAPRTGEDIARVAKLSPYVVRKSQTLARHLQPPYIKRLIADLLHLDIQLKTTAIDADEALQLYLIKLAT